jgi:phage/conjugal plasmid C-4 type zinc finger TraR family protein
MADRTGIATKLARVLGGRGSRNAADDTSTAPARRARSGGSKGSDASQAEGPDDTAKPLKATAGAKKAAAAKQAEKPPSVSKAAPAKKAATAKKSAAEKAPPRKAAVAKAAPAKKAATAQPGRSAATKSTTAVKSATKTADTTRAKAAKRTSTEKTPSGTTAAKATRSGPRGAGPTTKATARPMTTVTKSTRKASAAAGDGEYAEIRAALVSRAAELRREHDRAVADINDLQRDRVADGAGDDQADAGTKTFEREQEISLANGILDRLTQVEHALDRLDAGTYGHCERCGNPIPKARLEAFPSVTLCVTCKQIEERR